VSPNGLKKILFWVKTAPANSKASARQVTVDRLELTEAISQPADPERETALFHNLPNFPSMHPCHRWSEIVVAGPAEDSKQNSA